MQITIQSILFALGFLGFILADSDIPQGVTPEIASDLSNNAPVLSKKIKTKKAKQSQCYNYFLQKDGCVFSAAKKSERCPSGTESPDHCGHDVPTDGPMLFKATSHHATQKALGLSVSSDGVEVLASESSEDSYSQSISGVPPTRLVRRYDSELDSFTIAGGDGICGHYDENQLGVCLWASAADVPGSLSGGWMNGSYTKACGRQVYIQRKGNSKETVYAPVVDGCSFNAGGINDAEPGCFRIAFTNATFQALKPTEAEKSAMKITDLVWNFDNEHGNKPENAAP